MSITYPHDRTSPHENTLSPPTVAEEPFVPRYARTRKSSGRKSGGKIKTWMILAPVGALVLGGVAAVMLMNGGEETVAPLAEPAATAPVLPAVPVTGTAAAPLTNASTPAPVEAVPVPAAPVAREAGPLRRAAPTPAPRSAPRVEAPRVAPAPSAVTPRLNTAPTTSPTTTLNTAPATPTPAQPPAPAIVVEPLG